MRGPRITLWILLALLANKPILAAAEPSPFDTLFGHQSPVREVAFFPDGKQLVSAAIGEDPVRLWNLIPGECRTTFKTDASVGSVNHVAVSPDGYTLAIGSSNVEIFPETDGKPRPCTLRLYDLYAGTNKVIVVSRDAPMGIDSVKYSPDGKTLAVMTRNQLILWDVRTEQARATLEAPLRANRSRKTSDMNAYGFTSFDMSRDSRLLATGGYDHVVRLWDLATGRALTTFTGHEKKVNTIAFSPDGKTMASGSDDKSVRVWSLALVEPRAILRFPGQVFSLAYSPGGELLAIAFGSEKGTVTFCETKAYQKLASFNSSYAKSRLARNYNIVFSPDGGLLATCSADRTITFWKMAGIMKLVPR